MNPNIGIRRELHEIERTPPWPRVQGDAWDRASRFIYRVKDLKTLRAKTESVADALNLSRNGFGSYVIRRWYDFHTHEVALEIIADHASVQREENRYHHEIDFYLVGQPFDLKLTRFPCGFNHTLEYTRANVDELAQWLYVNQSRQRRFHAANRMFLVFRDSTALDQNWQLRRDFERIEAAMYAFLDEPQLIEITLADHQGRRHQPTTGVAFCVKE